MTEKKPYKKPPGKKVAKYDRVRIQLALEIQKEDGVGDYVALKQACLLVPRELPPPLPILLSKIPEGATRLRKFLPGDAYDQFKDEVKRLQKVLENFRLNPRWSANTVFN